MSQEVVALMWGVRSSELSDDFRIPSGVQEGEWLWEDYDAEDQDPPRDAHEGDCVGYKVAASVPDDDEGDLVPFDEAVAANDLDAHAHYTSHKIGARLKWERFVERLKEAHGLTLPTPQLWLTRDERA